MANIDIPQPMTPPSPGASPRLSAEAPLEAFGGGESAAQASKAGENLTASGVDLAETKKKNEDQMVLGQADVDLMKAKSDAMAEAMKHRGQDSDKALPTAKKIYDKAVNSIYSSMTNPQQQMAFRRSANEHAIDINSTLTNYKTQQIIEWDTNTTKARVTGYADEGIMSGGKNEVIAEKELKIEATWADYGKRMGWSPEEIRKNQLDSLSTMHGGVIGNYLAQGQYKMAQSYFDGHKTDIAPSRLPGLQNELRNGAVADASVGIWKQFGTAYRLSNGGVDLNKVHSKIMNTEGFTDREKVEIERNVRGFARDQTMAKAQQKQDDMEGFQNWTVKTRSDGVSQEDAMAQLTKHADPNHPYDYLLKKKLLQEAYSPARESDPNTLLNFHQQLSAGETLDQSVLDKAYLQDDTLSKGDYEALTKKATGNTTTGVAPGDKVIEGKINKMITDNFKDDPQNQARFTSYLLGATKGMSGQQKMDWAAKAMGEDDKENKYHALKNIDWKADLQKQNATDEAWKPIKQHLGGEVLNAITNGFASTKGPGYKTSPKDIMDFVDTLGGPDKVKPGTPAYQAIQLAVKYHHPVTATLIGAYLNKEYPNGW